LDRQKSKPDWLKIRLNINKNFQDVRRNLRSNSLHTVCEEANCPNIHECWGRGTATFMILGDTCTRSCRFCAVKTGRPPTYDVTEPMRVAESVKQMRIKHVVITSVKRDELKDGGSVIWAATIRTVRKVNPEITIEVLTPDFKGIREQLHRVLEAGPDVYSHNLETVPSLYRKVRPQAKYHRSLQVLKWAKEWGAITKTGIMLGLGEPKDEICELMKDAVAAGVDIFNMGQYLQPTNQHLPVERYVSPDEFEELKRIGLEMGFRYVEAGPLVRSSYHAETQYQKMLHEKRSQAANM
jgi:lipoic acid synthetase